MPVATAEPTLESNIDWDSWTPGSIPAARQAAKLDELIATAVGRNDQWSDRAAARGSYLASIEDHRLDRLSIAVADAVARGDSADQLARTLRGVLTDSRWASTVATTEMNRAMSAATLQTYRDSGVVDGKGWMTASDSSTCSECIGDQDIGAIPLDDIFPSGNDAPPGHVGCRCCLYAEMIDISDLGGGRGGLGSTSGSFADAEDLGLEDEDAFEAEDGDEAESSQPDVEQHDTVGSTREVEPAESTRPLTSVEQAQLAAQRRADREAAGQAPAATPEARDVSHQSEDDLAARIAELPPGVSDLRLGPDAGLGRLRVGRRRTRRNKAAGSDEDGEGDE